MRYTEYHAGVAVIRDKSKHKEAVEKLARLEDLEDIPEKICDEYCKYPARCADRVELDSFCDECKLVGLFKILT